MSAHTFIDGCAWKGFIKVQKSDLWIMYAATVKPLRTTNIQKSLTNLFSVVAM